ncbi:MAG: undecaprenyldiphospho-muramoylpentapeptide beta-N-acetylglucosaminyltransferase [Oscillospiraceae bacterium]
MRIVFTCGGTGGHIYPAIAVAKLFRERQPGCEILFIGAEDGMENKIVPREGFRLETLKISNYQRSLTPKALWHNVTTLCNMAGSLQKARRILRGFRPDVIVGTGGYASFPALREGARLQIPTAVHESNAVPGLTTRMVEKRVSRVMVSFEESRERYTDPSRVVVTGTPVREQFLYTSREEARRALKLDERPLVVSYWGSLGAREMNKKIAQFMKREIEAGEPFQHIHATGSFGWRWMPEYVKELGVDLAAHPSVQMQEYIYDMPVVMAAADLVICRAGAATISEVCASGTPCVMVPSPNVTDNHQEKNALALSKTGAAVLVREAECDGKMLFDTAKKILDEPDRLRTMRAAASNTAVVDAAERIYRTAIELAKA